MRKIKFIVIHCTGADNRQKTTSIIDYWKRVLGWKNALGYHWLVSADGTMEQLTPDEKIANGVKGYNDVSIHLCWKGGETGTDTRTDEQKASLLKLVTIYKGKYRDAEVLGHRDLSPDKNGDGKITKDEWAKQCPSFSAREEYANVLPQEPTV